jgi:release factor glutamine methyltransferase
MTRDIQSLLNDARNRLAAICDSPQLDAELLLAHVTGKDRIYFYTWPEHTLEISLIVHFENLLQRRLHGEPLAHIVGEREFWSLRLKVTPDTLIPRPETELLVEETLKIIPPEQAWEILDLGTGSGAIALALALERPRARIIATDLSAKALAIAAHNAQRLGLTNIRFAQGDWYTALEPGASFDLIVSNPPYIAEHDAHLKHQELRHEPYQALASGADGLDAIRHILSNLHAHLRSGGWILMEHGYDQGDAVQALFQKAGLAAVRCLKDLEGRDRVTLGRKTADNTT